MAKSKKREIGDIGEEIACIFLERAGFVIVERNYWKPWGEIDIIGKKDNVLRFVEVKSIRRSFDGQVSREKTYFGTRETVRPEENMHSGKIRRLHRAIQTYLLEKKVPEHLVWQIDLACVYVDLEAKKGRVELLENIIL